LEHGELLGAAFTLIIGKIMALTTFMAVPPGSALAMDDLVLVKWLVHSTCLFSWFRATEQEQAGLGLGDLEWRLPVNIGEGGTGGF
jgi:hypothetical protein